MIRYVARPDRAQARPDAPDPRPPPRHTRAEPDVPVKRRVEWLGRVTRLPDPDPAPRPDVDPLDALFGPPRRARDP
jgi:hypothetical protein